ncbi:MAG: metal-dependent hydrolase [Desulfotomaculaceae bacterium]|nr:metal-dependent hydrolase [Desulfotomaculaceae bacterium]
MKKKLVFALGAVIALIFGASLLVSGCAQQEKADAASQSAKLKIEVPVNVTYLGHSAVKLESGEKTVLVDPWIKDNPKCPVKLEDIKAADLILVTHDHFDHVGDTIALAKATGATVVAMPETAAKLQADGLPAEQVVFGGMGQNIGNENIVKDIGIIMTEAFHSSETGLPAGYIIKFPGGATVYHAGDTGIFANMETLAELYPIHLAFLPIGGTFTMDSYQAAKSLSLIKPAIVIPVHYATFPVLAENAGSFIELAKKEAPQVEVKALNPGESYTLSQ